VPAFQGFFVLGNRSTFFRIPALESIILLSAAEVQIFEQLLSVWTQEEIGEKKRGMRPRCVDVDRGSARVGDHEIHWHPSHRCAALGGDVGGAVKLAG